MLENGLAHWKDFLSEKRKVQVLDEKLVRGWVKVTDQSLALNWVG